ncbi:MAG: DUF1524 domain-containing protein [Actinobacteria bacterium]|nr:DUF1524 domain-containing protein [Actinomycetota bacterium]
MRMRVFGPLLIPILLFTGTPASTAVALKHETAASKVLEQIVVKGRAPKTGYSRAQFGPAWTDVDHNGCDTRNDILTRDLVAVVYRPGAHNCMVESGILRDPYSGSAVPFTRGVGTSLDVQIDHVVALSDAWQKGAFKLTLEKRTAFANDPLNLLAVMGRLNSQKSDGDAATWLPPLKSYRCKYVARQVAVKAKNAIWMTSAEKVAIAAILSKCPGELIPKG